MKTQLFVFLVSISITTSSYAEGWMCEEMASEKQGNIIRVCGSAQEQDISTAKLNAIHATNKEFDLICNKSADCKDFQVILTPLRNTCEKNEDGSYYCLRGMEYRVTTIKKDDLETYQKQISDLDLEIENKKDELNIRQNLLAKKKELEELEKQLKNEMVFPKYSLLRLSIFTEMRFAGNAEWDIEAGFTVSKANGIGWSISAFASQRTLTVGEIAPDNSNPSYQNNSEEIKAGSLGASFMGNTVFVISNFYSELKLGPAFAYTYYAADPWGGADEEDISSEWNILLNASISFNYIMSTKSSVYLKTNYRRYFSSPFKNDLTIGLGIDIYLESVRESKLKYKNQTGPRFSYIE
ncbi:hypothetical protein A9Q84_07220 [Halobacteriovorax marinus]|uniref:Secreted protein n=1 Tax=Halobacteriovorax marinus TaxID=97084 RepID=A0A1Y5F5S6_9BACT|nr:hypothetical protein A9Q84_07220 [Halobacteriovorax marinus]